MTGAPVRDAIILTEPGDATRPVAGLPLLIRTILTLQRAGVQRCLVIGNDGAPADDRIHCTVDAAPALEGPRSDGIHLLIGAGVVIDGALVREVTARAVDDEAVEFEKGGARVRVAPALLLTGSGGRRLRPRLGTLASASAPAAEVELALLRALDNPRDGWLDRLLHRRLSRPVTRLLLRTPLSPNAVTVLGIVLGVTGGVLLGQAAPGAVLTGVVLLLVSGVLDCSDGELARLRFAETRLGHWLDMAGDTLVHLAVLGGVAARLARAGTLPGWGTLVVLGVGVLGAFAVITWSEHTEARRRRVDAWENRVLDRVLSPLTTRDWYVFVIAFALAGSLDLLVPVAAVGAHVFWLVALVLLIRVLGRT